MKELDRLSEKVSYYRSQIRNDPFTSLPVDSKCDILDEASTFLRDGLGWLEKAEVNELRRDRDVAKRRVTQGINEPQSADTTLKDKREQVRTHLRSLNAEICLLYAPLIPDKPINTDAGKL